MADTNSPVGQVQEINDSLAKFFADRGTCLQSGGIFPEVADIAEKLDYSDLLRFALQFQAGGVVQPVGAAVENIHHAQAVLREYGMYIKTKSECYDAAQAESEDEDDMYSSLKVWYVTLLKGNYSEGL